MKKSRTIVCHGNVSHPLGAKCEFCDEVNEFFAQSELAKIAKMIGMKLKMPKKKI